MNNPPKLQPTCHPERKYVAKGMCKQCYDREYAAQNRERNNAKKRAWARANPDKVRTAKRKYLYGIDEASLAARLAAQDGLCKICGTAEATDVDHDHKTGETRSVLCGDCNRALGLFRENIQTLENAIAYIKLWGRRQCLRPSSTGGSASSEAIPTTRCITASSIARWAAATLMGRVAT